MKVRLKLPIVGVEEALVETMTDFTRTNIVSPEEWEDQFDSAALRLGDIFGEDETEVEIEVDLVKGTARMLLPGRPNVKFKPGQMYRPDLTELNELHLLD